MDDEDKKTVMWIIAIFICYWIFIYEGDTEYPSCAVVSYDYDRSGSHVSDIDYSNCDLGGE